MLYNEQYFLKQEIERHLQPQDGKYDTFRTQSHHPFAQVDPVTSCQVCSDLTHHA